LGVDSLIYNVSPVVFDFSGPFITKINM
jgi:hypothetical protein